MSGGTLTTSGRLGDGWRPNFSVTGQAEGLTEKGYVAVAERLRTALQKLKTLADAILVIAAQVDCEPDIGAKEPH